MDNLWKYYGSDWLGMVFAMVSTYYLGKERKRGFLLGIVGNLSWVVFGVLTESVANVLANVMYIVLNTKGFLRWKKNHQAKPPCNNS